MSAHDPRVRQIVVERYRWYVVREDGSVWVASYLERGGMSPWSQVTDLPTAEAQP